MRKALLVTGNDRVNESKKKIKSRRKQNKSIERIVFINYSTSTKKIKLYIHPEENLMLTSIVSIIVRRHANISTPIRRNGIRRRNGRARGVSGRRLRRWFLDERWLRRGQLAEVFIDEIANLLEHAATIVLHARVLEIVADLVHVRVQQGREIVFSPLLVVLGNSNRFHCLALMN
jgi:hypothetical protein